MTTVKHIDLLIQGEKQEAKYGWEKRVASLHNIKKKAIIIETSRSGTFDPWEGSKEFRNQILMPSSEAQTKDQNTNKRQDQNP